MKGIILAGGSGTRLNPATIAKAGFQRAAFASLLPIGANIIGSAYSDNPIFGYRTSGLDTNIITGNPTYSLIFQKLRFLKKLEIG